MLGVPNDTAGRARRRASVAELGFRRVALVRAVRSDGRTRFEVEGVVHRRPVTRLVTAGIAARLVAAGVPLVSHGLDTSGADPC